MTTTTISRRTLSSALFFFALFFVARTVFVVQVVYYLRVVFVCLLFFFSRSFFSSSSSRFGGFGFFFLIVGLHSLPFRRVVVYVAFCLSVGVDLGLKGVSLESSSSSSSVSSFRRKQRIGEKNGFFSMMLGRTPTTSSKLSFCGVRKILTAKMFVSLL